MEELERSESTPAGKLAKERLIDAVLDPGRYPEGTAFVAADQDDFVAILAATIAERRPLAIVYADGREIVAAPRGGVLAFLGHLLGRDRETRHHPPVAALPADYRVEVRDPRALAA